MDQVLYAQVIILRQKYLKFVATYKNKNEAKFEFKGLSAISQRWFDLDFDGIEVNFSTRDPDLYKKVFQSHEYTQNTQDTNKFKFFQVPRGNSKCVEKFKFQNYAPMLNYCQK